MCCSCRNPPWRNKKPLSFCSTISQFGSRSQGPDLCLSEQFTMLRCFSALYFSVPKTAFSWYHRFLRADTYTGAALSSFEDTTLLTGLFSLPYVHQCLLKLVRLQIPSFTSMWMYSKSLNDINFCFLQFPMNFTTRRQEYIAFKRISGYTSLRISFGNTSIPGAVFSLSLWPPLYGF